ncbi:MAG: hypothetical protein IT482_02065 [Gammaproteobacteria bacterium]|jgi:hypothetical protein|nr:hypothetical protein [Gammaproteobacteria bacterium]
MNRRWLPAAAAVGLLAIVAPVTLPGSRVWLITLENTMHAAVFALVALALSKHFNRWAVLGIAAALAAATELLQVPGPRTASLSDFWLDLAGAGLALGSVYARGTPRLPSLTLLLVSAALILTPITTTALAYRDRHANPALVARFDRPWSLVLTSATAEKARSRLPEQWSGNDSSWALLLRFPVADYPRVNFLEPAADWRPYRSLVLDVVNPETFEVPLTVMLRDDRPDNAPGVFDHARTVRVPPSTRSRFELDIGQVGRTNAENPLQLSRMRRLTLYLDHPGQPTRLYLVSARLE